jgi:thiol-disulfide isomerase/thioredoxin
MKSALVLLIALFIYYSTNTVIPSFRLKDLDNQYKNFDSVKGMNLTVIDFWSTCCKPCLSSIPKMIKLSEEFKDKGVNFVGISTDSPRNLSKVKPLVNSYGIKYPILLDTNNEFMMEANITAMPTILIINNKREILYFHEGFKAGDELFIKDEIEKQLLSINQNQ